MEKAKPSESLTPITDPSPGEQSILITGQQSSEQLMPSEQFMSNKES